MWPLDGIVRWPASESIPWESADHFCSDCRPSSLCSSKSNPSITSPSLQQSTSCSLHSLHCPISYGSHSSYVPNLHVHTLGSFIALNSSSHSLGDHWPLLPETQVGNLQIFPFPSIPAIGVPWSHPQLCSRTPVMVSLTSPLVDHRDLSLLTLHPPLHALSPYQIYQALPRNPQATPMRETGKLTAELHFSLCSSKCTPQLCSRLPVVACPYPLRQFPGYQVAPAETACLPPS